MKYKWVTRALVVGCALVSAAPAGDGGCGKPAPPPEHHDDDIEDALEDLADADHARAVRLRRAIREVVDREVCAATALLAAIVMNERLDTMTRSMAALALGELACRVRHPDEDRGDTDDGIDEDLGVSDAGCPPIDAGSDDMSADGGADTTGADDDDGDDGGDDDGSDDDGSDDSDGHGSDDDGTADDSTDDDDGTDGDDGTETGDDTAEGPSGSGSSRCERDRTDFELPDDFDLDEIVDDEGVPRAPFREESGLGRFEIRVLKRATRSAQPLGLRQSATRALGRAHVSSAIDLLTTLRDDAAQDAALRFVAAQSLTRITGRDHFDVAFRDDLVDRYIEGASGYELVEAE